ncbi:MAG TPA: VacJ family lipoprotein [Candidatus Polarisedimenticolaceae bacterium]|nr:VacJ family lipoprotein [Candidatus Polarisedimenticolaceae bacterium]
MKQYSSGLKIRINQASWFIVGAMFWLAASSSYALGQEDSSALLTDNELSTLVAASSAVIEQPQDTRIALASASAETEAAGDDFDSDPFEAFNEKMFWFNREVLDRFLLKPAATAWDFIIPDPVQRGIYNIFDNLAVVRRVVNNTLQWKLSGAGTELARFTINSTVGLVGFFDVARDQFGIQQRDEDTGQTFGVWGIGPGPYLVLPFLPPLTIRDSIGYAFDTAMTPYIYFIPWYANAGLTATSMVNERSLNLETFERVAESTIDLYGAVRNAYLQRRAAAIRQ